MNQEAKPEKKSKILEFHHPSWGPASSDWTPKDNSSPKDYHLPIS